MYQDFEYLLNEMKETYNMRILAYVIMLNHWHLLLYLKQDGDLSAAMGWLGTAHLCRYHAKTKTIGGGHLYQDRYKSFLVEDDTYLLTVIKYIERDPVRAKLAKRAEEWRWGSAYRRLRGTPKQKALLYESPTPLPRNYRFWVNQPELAEELSALRVSVIKGVPYGRESWRDQMIKKYELHQTLRALGRPIY